MDPTKQAMDEMSNTSIAKPKIHETEEECHSDPKINREDSSALALTSRFLALPLERRYGCKRCYQVMDRWFQ